MKLTSSIKSFLSVDSIWHQVTNNQKAQSCRDAANKRNRLGNIGIPLTDELKTNFGFFYSPKGEKNYVMLHCRGNHLICEVKVKEIFGSDFHRMSTTELESEFDLKYGLINPFTEFTEHDVLQLFDKTVLNNILPPYTMMTNAGSYYKGIEFKPWELINILPNKMVSDIVLDYTRTDTVVHSIGILTGNSPESGLMLWETMNTFIRSKMKKSFMGDISFPRVLIESIPEMGLSMELELREEETKKAVLQAVEVLCKRGATIVALACNTTQFFRNEIEELCARYNVVYMAMVDIVHRFLDKKRIKEFDFLGIKYVTDFEKWSAFKTLKDNFNINLPSKSELQEINVLAFEVKQKKISGLGINKLRDLINNSTKSEYVLIALTELSILLASQQKQSKKVYIDTLSLLAEELADEFVKGISGIFDIPKSK